MAGVGSQFPENQNFESRTQLLLQMLIGGPLELSKGGTVAPPGWPM